MGRAVAILFAKAAADVPIFYLSEDAEAVEPQRIVEEDYGRKCFLIATDISKESNCKKAVASVMKK
ncbi:MAG: hypothetical protein ABIO46_07735 [Chitinophagales bacterium]